MKSKKDIVEIYTDGSCLDNQSNGGQRGGWAALLILKINNTVSKEKMISGCSKETTNNQMEITAVIKALEELKSSAKNYNITIYTDSQYVIGGSTNWKDSWMYRNYRGVKNADLWKRLHHLIDEYNPNFQHVKAHNGHPENERVDKEARLKASRC